MRKALLVGGAVVVLVLIGLIAIILMPGLPVGWETVMGAESKDVAALVRDPARRARLEKAYDTLQASGRAGRLSTDGLNAVQQKYLEVTRDKNVTDAEADELAELVEQIAAR